MRNIASAVLGLLIAGIASAASEQADLRTLAEQSDFKRTGRYDEVVRLCSAYQKAWPKQVRCFEFGKTPEGRPMMALAASADGVLDAKSARTQHRPVFLVQGGIHAGEIDGKDAGFLALRDLLEHRAARDALKNVTVVFVPVFNVDGHERFGPNNRPNQVGPEEMGWRVTAQNLNLNRDYVKADVPEMQAMLHLLNQWDPIVYADLHVTDGAEFEHDISINVAPTVAGDDSMKEIGIAMRDAVIRDLKTNGSLPLDFYPSFVKADDPSSGFSIAPFAPRFSHEYWARRNRIGVLVETHSWKDYKTRVRATYRSILSIATQLAEHGDEWLNAARDLDLRSRSLGGKDVALAYEATSHFKTIDFRGYHYTRELSPISGGLMTRYDTTRPEIWRVPLFDDVRSSVVVRAPHGGYVVPAAWAAGVANKLDLHKVAYRQIAAREADLQTFRARAAHLARTTNEARAMLTVEGEWKAEHRAIPANSLFVPIAQPNVQLAMILLEPKSPDSLVSWGFFNAAFERKEYMEAYVAEQVALDMLSKDAKLRTEFERRLKEDAEFANSPQSRLEFFYRRHPSWDERFNLYPVYRIDFAPGD